MCLISASLSLGHPNIQQPSRSPPIPINHSPLDTLEGSFMSSSHYACPSVVTDQDINNKKIFSHIRFASFLYRASISIVIRSFIKIVFVAVPGGFSTNKSSITAGRYTPTITHCPQDV